LRIIESDKKRGSVEVEVEDSDDLWHLYNLIDRGDTVCGNTLREVKVYRGGEDERGGRRRVYLCIKVDDLGFQTFTERLRIKGQILTGPDDMNIQGLYHSFSVGTRDRISIVKEHWLSFHKERLERALSKERPKAVIVTIDEQNASVFMLRDYVMQELLTIESNIPGKYVDSGDRSAIKTKFISSVGEEIGRVLEREKSDVIVAGPGFTKGDLARYLKDKLKGVNIIEETTSSTGSPGVREVMNRGALSKIMKNSTIMRDSHLVDELLSRLASKPSLVAYGKDEVALAVERGAVDSILVSERLFKEITPEQRKEVESICKKVEGYGGKVFFIGGEHEKGRQLIGLGSVAAFLRFPI
jgi:protein pelota